MSTIAMLSARSCIDVGKLTLGTEQHMWEISKIQMRKT